LSGTDYTKTPNLGLFKPIVDADLDQWGTHLNTNADTLDTKFGVGGANGPFVPIAGGSTMTGTLTLSGPPTTNLMAATKNYVDTSVVPPSTTLPGMDGTAAVGIGTTYARADHIHPTDTTLAPKASPVLTGNPQSVTPATADSSTSIATTAFVKAAIASGASIVVSDTPPTPQPNMLWFDSVGCNLYLYYSDPNSSQFINVTNTGGGSVVQVSDTPPSTTIQGSLWWDSTGLQLYCLFNDGNSVQWVPATNQSGLLAEAPQDSQLYARQNSTWQPVPNTTGSVGRSYIHNGLFNVQQRGAGSWGTNGQMTADRWQLGVSGSSLTIAINTQNDPGRAQIGDEACVYVFANAFSGTAGASDFANVAQRIEKVQRLSGKTVIVSFWAAPSVANLKVGVELYQSFGTGGSPSAGIAVGTQAVTLAAVTYTRYSLSFAVPSMAGKTLGTNGDDWTQLAFWFTSGSTLAGRAGNIGVQSGTIWLWGVQLEVAAPGQTAPSPLEKIEVGDDLRHCQRFYQVGSMALTSYQIAGSGFGHSQSLPVTMRAIPTVTSNMTTQTNTSGSAINSVDIGTMRLFGGAATTSSAVIAIGTFTASADL